MTRGLNLFSRARVRIQHRRRAAEETEEKQRRGRDGERRGDGYELMAEYVEFSTLYPIDNNVPL